MKAQDFVYWLQGYFEINGTGALTAGQVDMIYNKASMVKAGSGAVEAEAKAFVDFTKGALSGVPDRPDAAALQKVSRSLQKELNDLFVHSIDPSYEGDQQTFNDIHTPSKKPPRPGKHQPRRC